MYVYMHGNIYSSKRMDQPGNMLKILLVVS